jgi:hypothetical protein
VAKEIIQHLLEDDDESWKDLVSSADNAAYPADYGEALYLYDESGRVIASSRNLAGIRRYVSRQPVQSVHIHDLGKGEGGIKVVFLNNWFWLGRFASFGVLTWSLRNWRNLYGATLFVNGQPGGRISYRNAALQEGEGDDFEVKDLVGGNSEEEVTLDQMKAAEPNFFSRETNRFFGTKKLYQYGSYLVVKNKRRMPGYFGGTVDSTKFIIYRFMRTENSPQGVIMYQQEAPDLQTAKAMIKAQDFRPWREQFRARLGLPESEALRLRAGGTVALVSGTQRKDSAWQLDSPSI